MPEEGKAHYVVDADFVSTDEGTGVVHTSALYGVDDLRLCQEKGIPFKHTVGLDGKFLPYVEKFAGLHVKEADPVITDDLRQRGLLYKAETILHTYPECRRCRPPLIYYALDVGIRDRAQRGLIANNNATNWCRHTSRPAHGRLAREQHRLAVRGPIRGRRCRSGSARLRGQRIVARPPSSRRSIRTTCTGLTSPVTRPCERAEV